MDFKEAFKNIERNEDKDGPVYLDFQFTKSFAELGILKPEWFRISVTGDYPKVRSAIWNYCNYIIFNYE